MSEQWFYTSSGARQGPVTHEELRQQAATGRLRANDLVWCEGMPQWVSAQSVEGLLPALPESHVATATLPTPTPLERWANSQQPAAYPEPAADYSRNPEAGVREVLCATRLPTGKSTKEIQLIVVVGLAVLALVVVGIVAAVLTSAAKDPGNIRSFPIRPGEVVAYEVKLQVGVKTQVWVTSDAIPTSICSCGIPPAGSSKKMNATSRIVTWNSCRLPRALIAWKCAALTSSANYRWAEINARCASSRRPGWCRSA